VAVPLSEGRLACGNRCTGSEESNTHLLPDAVNTVLTASGSK